ncbi:hypothetical protein FHR32_003373 [Streptosporangium album]|uniref:Capsular polysaccharide biosynthesis protein n=1 Tax=Streptosporangium album TaxID=47479 RepID=A0A7W7RWW4_9ACTN|nr:hypothetical protein [Streptosporangium album]MBB4939068.1 hypothetical protein [Streptosporangium album]
MDFWKAVFGLVRRKLIGPPLLALSLVTAALVFFLMPTYYVSTASMVLTIPATGGTLSSDPTRPIGLTNPLLQFSDGLRVTAGILILSMNTPEVAADLGVVKDGPTQITINDGRTNPDLLGISTNGPFVYVEVQSRSAAAAQDVVLKAKQRIRRELTNRQQALRAPRSTFISVVDVVPSSTPEAKMTGKLTAGGGALFAVLFIGLGIAYGVTQIRAGRRRSVADVHPSVPSVPGASAGSGRPDHRDGPVAEQPPKAVSPSPEADESGEGPFHDDSLQLVVVVDDEEGPFAHREEQSMDTIVFMRAGGRDEHDK